MHKNDNSGLPLYQLSPFIDFGILFACSEYVSKSMQGNQRKFEILVVGNDRKCLAHEPLP